MQNPDTNGCSSTGCGPDLWWHGTGGTIGSDVAGFFTTLTGDGSKAHMMLESGKKATGSDGNDGANVVCMCYKDHGRCMLFIACYS